MKAVTFDHHGGPEVLRYGDHPRPVPNEGDALVRVTAIGVNPADGKWRGGMFEKVVPLTFPHVPGYDVAGTIAAPGSSGLAVGTRVVAMLDPHRHGGYADYAIVSPGALAALPDGVDDVVAAALPTAGLTGLQMMEEQLDVQPGQVVLLTGATGAVGRFALFAARRRGARIVAAVRPAYRHEAIALGADAVVELGGENWDGAPYDHVADTVGGAAVAALCRHLRDGGSIRTVSTTPIPSNGLPAKPVFFPVRADGPMLAGLAEAVAAGDPLVPIARVMPLADAAEAQRLTDAGGAAGKIVLRP